ncbi:nuclear transport factor 2 family protein [Teredinibacter waterburyi]|jgi:hypothetical protein|uniref:nuclear transport factor 2 family protein n=1 Tax=Teredinibacter waterburyi TaxID=1500538 RepID=UPI00165FACED|nr:nuclear transport factor 2 family protein [Teredinibacter waterburyi]
MSTAQPQIVGTQLVERFKRFYADIRQLPLDDIESLYHPDVVFKDPVHCLRGTHCLHAYMSDICTGVSEGRFEYLDQVIGLDSAYIKWNMHFVHPRLGSRLITVRGMSQIKFCDRIHYHEDVYDMGAMLYEHVPVIGGATRWLRKNLVKKGQ